MLENIAKGMPLMAAAARAGLSWKTAIRWINDERENGKDSQYYGFSDRVDQAKAKSMEVILDNMQEAGEKDWRMWAFMLERRFPQHFGKLDRVAGADGGAVKIEVKSEMKAVSRVLERLRSDGDSE